MAHSNKNILKSYFPEPESGSNSYAKSNQDTIKKLKKLGTKLTPASDKDIEIVTDTKIIKKKD